VMQDCLQQRMLVNICLEESDSLNLRPFKTSNIMLTMPRSDESIINNALNDVSHLLSNVGNLKSAPPGSKERKGFTKFSKLFCDSIIFWGMYNFADETTKGTAIGKYIAELRDAFNHTDLVVESVKLMDARQVKMDDNYFSARMAKRHRRLFVGKEYQQGFIAIKVSLDFSRAKVVVPILTNILPLLNESGIALHDIDFAYDCKYITTRLHVERLLKEGNTTEIVDDVAKVGHHCISWRSLEEDTKNIRYKVYNKFVQILESAEVRKSLGSRLEDLVEKETAFGRRVKKYKKHGYSRIELSFYGSSLRSLQSYQDEMEETKNFLKECRTFKCSFETQWQERAKCITSMAAVYFPHEKVFAYCHWWNSVTSKKYGYMWKEFKKPKLIPLLLANFSFNDRPIYFVEGHLDEKDKVVLGEIRTFKREPGCTAITLVAGSQKGMFPSRDASHNGIHEFSKVGIVEVDNISIAWPKRVHNKNSVPLADIFEYDDDTVDTDVLHLNTIHVSMYTADHQVLEPNTEYTIVAAGLKDFRGARRWHFITECGVKVRAGKSLEKIWRPWRVDHLEGPQRIGSVEGVPIMTFRAVRKVRSQGKDFMKCERA
jgi:hypothetical protein